MRPNPRRNRSGGVFIGRNYIEQHSGKYQQASARSDLSPRNGWAPIIGIPWRGVREFPMRCFAGRPKSRARILIIAAILPALIWRPRWSGTGRRVARGVRRRRRNAEARAAR